MIKKMEDRKYYSKIFNGVHGIDVILERLQKDRVDEEDWRKLIQSI